MTKQLDVPATWKDQLADMTFATSPGGHFFPDHYPDETAEKLLNFLNTHRTA